MHRGREEMEDKKIAGKEGRRRKGTRKREEDKKK